MRSVAYSIPTDTSLFTPLQLHPRSVLWLAMNAWANWLRQYLVSFRKLVEEERTSVVVTEIHMEYSEPFRFFDADEIKVNSTVELLKSGKLMRLVSTFGGEAPAVKNTLYVCPVRLDETDSFSARPAALPEELIGQFQPDETAENSSREKVPHLVRSLEERSECLASGCHEFMFHRSQCEVADQWSYIELPCHVECARETLVHRCVEENPELGRLLVSPIRRIDARLTRPFFIYDECRCEIKVYTNEERLFCVSKLFLKGREDRPHAIVVEQF